MKGANNKTREGLTLTSVVKSLSCVQLFCDPTDRRLPGSSVHGIFQAPPQGSQPPPMLRGDTQKQMQFPVQKLQRVSAHVPHTGTDPWGQGAGAWGWGPVKGGCGGGDRPGQGGWVLGNTQF